MRQSRIAHFAPDAQYAAIIHTRRQSQTALRPLTNTLEIYDRLSLREHSYANVKTKKHDVIHILLQKRKYITYCTVVRGGPIHKLTNSNMCVIRCVENSVKFGFADRRRETRDFDLNLRTVSRRTD